MLNFRVVWLDTNFHERKDAFQNSLNELGATVNNISTFIDTDQSIDFVTDNEDESIFMIISAAFVKTIIPNIHDVPQLHAIFIFCNEKSNDEGWIQQWPKVRGIFTDVQSVCKAIHQIIKQWEQDIIPMSFITADNEECFITAKYHHQLDKSFMHMYLLRDVAFETDNNNATQSIKALIAYSRQVYAKNPVQLEKIARFERDFQHRTLLWWYTYDYFLFSMLNQALRTLDVELIVRMEFVFRQLNHQISQLHQQQARHYQVPFTVYRGQSLSVEDLQKLQQAKGGLLSFNSFLCTTIDQQTAIVPLPSDSKTTNILFIMQINPVLNTKPFAGLDPKIACCKDDEKEILFCMYTVFRIKEIRQVYKENCSFWHVHLTLIPGDDPILLALDGRIQEETRQTSGWNQTGRILMEAGEVDKAEKLHQILVKAASNDYQRAYYSSALADVYGDMNKCAEAIAAYQDTLGILEKIQPTDYWEFAALYTNIGLQHSKAGEYSQALACHELALNIRENNLAPNHLAFSHSYINLGELYFKMKNCSMALFYLEKGLKILQQSFSPTHPDVKNCLLGIKIVKKKLLEEEEEKKKTQKQSETEVMVPKSNLRSRVCKDERLIFGRNHFSNYVNDSHERVRYKLYWLDMNVHDQADLEAELRHIIPLMERFDDATECEAEIKNAVGCTIVLIIAATLSMQFIPLIHDLTCVTKILIYLTDGSSPNYEELMKTYGKITAIVLTQRDLIEKISEDWEEKEKTSLLPFGTANHWDVTLESRKSSMLWFKLLISLLTRFENKNNKAKEELVKFMQTSYHGNARQLENIDIFEQKYRAADAINWYTRDFCLYRLVNKAFRLGSINSLFSLRLFIQDVYAQLRSLHAEQRRMRCETKQPITRSFRGQTMLDAELTFLFSDQYAIVSSFFSTSTDREQALGFLVGGVVNRNQVLVFFAVNANMSLTTVPFADISTVSNSRHENEILYAPGTLFHINSKRFDRYDDVWIIELELCDEEDFPLKATYDSFNSGYKNQIGLCDFSLFLINMGEYKKAEKFLLCLLNELTTIGADLAECHHALGRVAYHLDDYDRAVSHHEIALDIWIQGTPADVINLAVTYNDLAEGYCKLKRLNLAMDFNDLAIGCSLQVEDIHRRNDLLGNCNQTAGKVLLMKQQYGAALQSLNVALDCRRRYYPPNHPFITDIYMSIGMVYFQMEKYSEALQVFDMVVDQFLEQLPLTHPYIGDVLYNRANTEWKMCIRGGTHETSNLSMVYFSEAYNIFQHSLPAKSCRFLRAKETLKNCVEVWALKHDKESKCAAIVTPASYLF